MPNPLMPKAWLWMNYISATTWVIYGLSASQLGEEMDPIVAPGTRPCAAVPFGHSFTVIVWDPTAVFACCVPEK